MRLLLAEDDLALGNQIRQALAQEGRIVDVVQDGDEAAFLGSTESYDLIILDLGLPKRDGLSILREWRAEKNTIPVLILTARDGWSQRVDGLDVGADDYIVTPFHMAELPARVRALLRRRMGQQSAVFEIGAFSFETSMGRALVKGIAVDLTAQEAAVLTYLVNQAGRLVSRTELSEHIYAYDDDRNSNTIAVLIARLRKKLEADMIQTIRGRGYKIDQA